MKKVLFTLAAVAMAVTASAASTCPVLGFSQTEVETAAGETVEIVVQVKDAAVDNKAFQIQYVAHDPAGALATDLIFVEEAYGNAFAGYTRTNPLGLWTMIPVSIGSSNPEPATFRVIPSNTTTNRCLFSTDYVTSAGMSYPMDLFAFKVTLPAEWDEEYITIDHDVAYGNFSNVDGSCLSSESPETQTYSIKLINKNYQPTQQDAEKPVITMSDAYVVTATPATALYIVNEDGTETLVENPYTITQTYEEQEITFHAVNAPAGYNAAETTETFTVPAKEKEQAEKPVITMSDAFVVTASPATALYIVNEDGTETLVENPYAITQTYEEQEITFHAVNDPGGNYTSNETTETFTVPAKETTALDKPEITPVTNRDGTVTVTIEGTNVYYGDAEDACTNQYTEPIDYSKAGNYTIYAYADATEEGYTDSEVASATFTVVQTVAATAANIVIADANDNTVTYAVTGLPEGVTVTVTVDGTAVTLGEGDTFVVNKPAEGQPNIDYAVVVNTKKDYELANSFETTLSVGFSTAVNEIAGDKTVANVRYFNMAGQEMTEANGMTIVVTTYTDGTTSAVKVRK